MKRNLLSLVIIFGLISLKSSAQEFRVIKNDAFQRGEKISYRAYYHSIVTGKVTAGICELEVTAENQKVANRNTYRIVGKGFSKGPFSYFFRVVDRYESVVDEQSFMPWLFIRRVNEGGYKIEQDVVFNQIKKTATTNKKAPIAIPEYTQDIISAFYYTRTMDFTNAKKGDSYPINFYFDDSVYSTKFVFEGRQTIKIGAGTFNCLMFKPMVLKGKVFSEPFPVTLWVTDDKNKIPVFAESAILVGKVKMELISYSGLKNPLISKIK
ncbi:MAG: DUF3108 domain-containing protein [Bacteroidota bacterium]